jgi:Zn finger protein HypA/HybF involved in hydrogenase expression
MERQIYSTKGKRDIISVKVSKTLKGKYESGELVSSFRSEATRAKMLNSRAEGKQKQQEYYLETGIYVKGVFGKDRIKKLKIAKAENKCEECGQDYKWNGKYLQHQVHHIDGDEDNWNWDNLQCLCPNCHTQTNNFANKAEDYTGDVFKFMVIENNKKLKENMLP